jgi:ABC-type lipoprotein export system ATPase subunit
MSEEAKNDFMSAYTASTDKELEDYLDENTMILCENLVKIYKTSDTEVLALQGLELKINKGEFVAIIGSSGSGKSTFLNMIGGLDRPSAGKLYVDGKDLFKMNEKEYVSYKQETVGFVWQNNARNLFPYLTAIQNVMLPMLFNKSKEDKEKRALELLELVGMSHRKESKLSQLSGGEQQRIAIAIALANNPKLLLADEPTGSVDQKTSDQILEVFNKLNKELGTTIVIVTHDVNLANKVKRVIMIRDGKTSSERVIRQDKAGNTDFSLKDNSGNTSEANQAEGSNEKTIVHEDYVIIDRVGRLQIPREALEAIGITGNKVKLEVVGDKIIISKP